MPRLVTCAERSGWYAALKQVIEPLAHIGAGMFQYVTVEAKGDLVFVTDVAPGKEVLDLGCGLGAVAVAIAARGAMCHVLDVSREQVEFTLLRCRQMGFSNVVGVCAGADLRLPIADRAFDTVIMNGVLEWIGCADRRPGSPEDARLAMLLEVNRVLRPSGQLYVATKNRYALPHFLGSALDHGTGIPWLGLLPVRIQLLMARSGVGDSGARLCGIRGYRRLFRAAGFAERAAYAVLPDFRGPRRFVPLNSATRACFGSRTGQGIWTKKRERYVAAILPLALLKRLVYCYGFVLEKR